MCMHVLPYVDSTGSSVYMQGVEIPCTLTIAHTGTVYRFHLPVCIVYAYVLCVAYLLARGFLTAASCMQIKD